MKQDLEKVAVLVICRTPICKFNGILLLPREKSKEKSLKKEKCPICDKVGCLGLFVYN